MIVKRTMASIANTRIDNVKAPSMMMIVQSVGLMLGNYLFSFDSVFTGNPSLVNINDIQALKRPFNF